MPWGIWAHVLQLRPNTAPSPLPKKKACPGGLQRPHSQSPHFSWQGAGGTHIPFTGQYTLSLQAWLWWPLFLCLVRAGQGFTLTYVSQWGWLAWAPGCLVSALVQPPRAAAAWISLSPKIEKEFFPWRFTSLGPVSIFREGCFVSNISKPSQTAAFAKYNNLDTDGKKQWKK